MSPARGHDLPVDRPVDRTLDSVVDVVVVLIAGALTATAVWVSPNPVGTDVAGPVWLVSFLPFLWAVPLWWRRSRPLLAWVVIMAALTIQSLVSGSSPEGFELIFVFSVGLYSVAAYSPRTRALIGLGVAALGYAVYALSNQDIRSGRAGDLWAGGFFAVELVACWLAGAVVRELRERRGQGIRRHERELVTEQALADERARLARDLHDIVSHNLSVVVVQAAGARAQGHSDDETLAKIERSGRESLVEMRRLLGVLRSEDERLDAAPQPRLDDVPALAEKARDAGVAVELDRRGLGAPLPRAVELTAYRVVQEALANVVRHAGPGTSVLVTLETGEERLLVRVMDDGRGLADTSLDAGGHGLLGMQERVALMGGRLRAGPRDEGGFEIWVELPAGVSS